MKKVLCVIVFLFSFLLVGCNLGKELTNTPTKQVEIFLNKYQILDKDVLDDLDQAISEEEDFDGSSRERYRQIMKDSFQKLAFQIKDQKEDGDKAIVTAEVEVVNFGKVLSASRVYLESHPEEFYDEKGEHDSKKFMDYRLKQMKENYDKIKYTIDFHLTKRNEEWKLDDLSKEDLQKLQGIYQY